MLKKKAPDLPMLSEEAASNIMNNVFSECGMEPSTVPLSVLSSYSEYRRERYTLQKGILIGVLILFLLLPLLFVAPDFQVTEKGKSHTGVPRYEVKVNNFFPVRLVSAKLDGRSIAVYESDARVFTVEPSANGKLSITITLANHQYAVWTADISGIDRDAPKLRSSQVIDGNLKIFLEDAGVGINYEGIYAISAENAQVAPLRYDEAEGSVTFRFDRDLNIFVPDTNGNMLQLVLSVKDK